MLSISKSLTAKDLQYRYLGGIAALMLISLLSSLSGLSSDHTISNAWDGLLWGLADPVLQLDSLGSVIAIGLLSASVLDDSLITLSLLSSAVLGILLHLLEMDFFGADMAIAISTIVLGGMLVIPQQRHSLVLVILGAIAGASQGYAATPSLNGVVNLPTLTYVLGTILTLYAVAISAKKIGNSINREMMQNAVLRMTQVLGLAVCGIGIVFLYSLIP
ncbi:MAG TPA: HupE/UreJ family protein [Trichormus sp. M33_DOE_039]|nr:HupE/UreJ family protein [Trichormus sp. M33_DOE_039]